MSQFTLYKYATWSLLFLNIAVLAFFLLTKPRPPHHSPPNNFKSEVIEILKLNNQQETTFKKLADEHNQKMKSIMEQQHQLLPPYFRSLTDYSKSIDEDRLLTEFQQLEREKIEITYQHFEDIKLMLDESQLSHFEGLMVRFIENILLKK